MFHAHDEIPQTLNAQPESFDARFAIALSAEEAAKHGDLANYVAHRRHRFGNRFNDGLKTEAFRYPSEANRQIRAAPDLCDPYDLLETWPKPLTGSDAYRAFGKELVTGDRSPARMLRDSPYLKSTGHMLSEIVLP